MPGKKPRVFIKTENDNIEIGVKGFQKIIGLAAVTFQGNKNVGCILLTAGFSLLCHKHKTVLKQNLVAILNAI